MNHSAPLCHAEQSTLLMVDIQERLLAAMAQEDREHLIQRGSVLLQSAKHLGIPVLATEQYPRGLGATDDRLIEALGAIRPLEKTCFSCCDASGFTAALPAQRQQVIVFGIEAHICVLQTAMELLAAGKQVFVAGDAVSSRHGEHKHNALQRMAQAGIIITNSESIVFEWLRDARHKHFKTLSALLK